MVSPNLVAAVLTLLPAMGMIWFYLGRYEGYFAQNRLFFALIMGFFGGIVVRLLEVWAFQFESAKMVDITSVPYSFFYTTFGYALVESLGTMAVLGFKNFRLRKDTAYYGTAFGLGFGAMWALQVVTAVVAPYTVPGLHLDFVAYAKYLELLLFSAGIVLVHGAAAAWVGKGATEGKLWKGVLWGALWLAPALAIYWTYVRLSEGLIPAIAEAGYGFFAIYMAQERVLEKIVPPELRDLVRKERRREARKQARE